MAVSTSRSNWTELRLAYDDFSFYWRLLDSYFKAFSACALLLLVGAGVRWVLLSPNSEASMGSDLITYRFKPQVQSMGVWGARQVEVPQVSSEIPSERLDVVESEKVQSTPSKEKLSPAPSRSSSKIFAASRVIQVKTMDRVRYVVEPGDRLDSIAKKFYGSYQKYRDILAANPGVDPKGLRPGMVLVIPEKPEGLPVNSLAFVEEPQVEHRLYEVRRGDTLSEIAQRELGSMRLVPKILELNPGLRADRLKLGESIKLPTQAGSAR